MKLLFIRHGQSESNVSREVLSSKPDHLIELSELGTTQAYEAGKRLKSMNIDCADFFVSPFTRAKHTLREIIKNVKPLHIVEDIRLREQDVGNFIKDIPSIKDQRRRHSSFFYRFPDGESAADVYVRVKQFLLDREDEIKRSTNPIIVAHAATIKVFKMIMEDATYTDYDAYDKPKNGEIIELENDDFQY
jgi:broad specificity phosphatase PhoE